MIKESIDKGKYGCGIFIDLRKAFHNWFKLNHLIHGHNARSNYNVSDGVVINNLFVPSVRTSNYGLKQIKVKGPRIWNDLPVHLKNTRSVYVFLKNLKAYYISNYE